MPWKIGRRKRSPQTLVGAPPTSTPEAPKEPRKKRAHKGSRANYDWLRADEVDALLSACEGTRDRAILSTFFYLGCRCNELRMLNVEDVDFHDGVVRILHAKGGKQRTLPMDEETLRPALYAWLALRPDVSDDYGRPLFTTLAGPRISNRQLRSLVKAYGKKAGVGERIVNQGLHPHAMRHTAASLMVQNGVDLRTVQEFLGHADLSVTAVYLGVDQGMKRKAQAALGEALRRSRKEVG